MLCCEARCCRKLCAHSGSRKAEARVGEGGGVGERGGGGERVEGRLGGGRSL